MLDICPMLPVLCSSKSEFAFFSAQLCCALFYFKEGIVRAIPLVSRLSWLAPSHSRMTFWKMWSILKAAPASALQRILLSWNTQQRPHKSSATPTIHQKNTCAIPYSPKRPRNPTATQTKRTENNLRSFGFPKKTTPVEFLGSWPLKTCGSYCLERRRVATSLFLIFPL